MEKLDQNFIKKLSLKKKEPSWMLDFRLKSLEEFYKQNNPSFGPRLDINFNKILYYKNEAEGLVSNWDNVKPNIKDSFANLGVINAEEKYLDGVTNQFESEVIYHKQKTDKDIIFTSTDEALQKYPDLFKKYFNKLVKYNENKYTA